MSKEVKITKPGTCPYCGSTNVTYGTSGPDGNQYVYHLSCDDCGESANEWYELVFIETIGE